MSNADKRVSYLFNLYYTKQATPAQLRELFELLDAMPDEELTGLMRDAWENLSTHETIFSEAKSNQLLEDILSERRGSHVVVPFRSTRYKIWSIAATALLAVAVGAYFMAPPKPALPQMARVRPAHDALPGTQKAILTLSNGSTIVLDNSGNGVLAREGGTKIIKKHDGQVNYQAADDADAIEVAYNTVTTPKGYQYHVVLPDGSNVWLNAASSIKFPTRFTGSQRRVEITGEAYFEVTKNPAMPFIVAADKEEVRVLGTHFDVMAYADEQIHKTTLLEGAIQLTAGGQANVLKPGNQAVMDSKGIKIIEDADMDEAVAWKNGLFQFKDESIAGILRQAARWYDVDVTYQGKVPTRCFTGKISRNVKLSDMLSMFRYAGINFSIDGNKLTVLN